MIVVESITITDAILDSSNVPENDHAVWLVGTAYTTGNNVIVLSTHRIYEAQIGSTGVDPATDDGTTWLDIGATNRWRVFDQHISDPTTQVGDIVYTMTPSVLADSVAFFGLDAAAVQVKCTDPVEGVIYNTTREIIDNSVVFDGWSYVFEPVIYDTETIFSGVPIYTGVVLEITISGAGTNLVGQIVTGRGQLLGETLVGTDVGSNDYSTKDRDAFGNAIIVEKPFTQTVDFIFSFPTDDALRINRILTRLRAKPAVYYAGDDTSQFGTTVYGFYNDYSIPLSAARSFATIQVEGLT